MAAEPLPLGVGATGPLPSWELEAWYEDLQEVLSSEETGRQPQLPGVAEQVSARPGVGGLRHFHPTPIPIHPVCACRRS